MKVIFTAGPPGSGKTTLLQLLDLSNFNILNIDNELKILLKKKIGHMNYKKMSLEELSLSGKLMQESIKIIDKKYNKLIKLNKNIIIDGTGASSKNLLEKKEYLESIGYETFMIFTYVNPNTSLKRNNKRNRKLPTTSVLESWYKTICNIDIYQFNFKNNICIINNDLNTKQTNFNIENILKKYPMPKGKIKTLEEKEKKYKKIQLLENNIINILNKKIIFDNNLNKINYFINK